MKKTFIDKINIQTEIVEKIMKSLNMANNMPVSSESRSDKGRKPHFESLHKYFPICNLWVIFEMDTSYVGTFYQN